MRLRIRRAREEHAGAIDRQCADPADRGGRGETVVDAPISPRSRPPSSANSRSGACTYHAALAEAGGELLGLQDVMPVSSEVVGRQIGPALAEALKAEARRRIESAAFYGSITFASLIAARPG